MSKSSTKINPGDLITLTTKTETLKGNYLPSSNNKTIILKLDSGYNIGILKKNIKKIKKIKSGKKFEFPSLKIKQKTNLPQVSIIATGGTISSKIDYETGAVKWLMQPNQVFSLAPEISEIIKIRKIETPFMIASENMSADHWKKIAILTAKLLNQGDQGVIITHGTDFLHMTAAALSFMLQNLTKPVILTYSQRSTDRGSTDTVLNLTCSAHAAKSDIAEVMLVGHAQSDDSFCIANKGTKVRKMHTSRRDTFRPINDLPLAKIWPDGKLEILNKSYKKRAKGKVKADTKFEEKVALIKYYPGARPEIIDFLVDKGYKGLVIEMSGLGHVATDESKYNWLPSIKKAINKGIIICAAPQTLYGSLNPLVYTPGRKILETGVLFLEDMLPETAYVKLGWVLGHTKNKEKIREMMLTNYAGEFNKRISPNAFLY